MKFGKKLERLLLAEMGVCLIVLLLSMSGRCSSMAILLSTLFQIFMIIYIIVVLVHPLQAYARILEHLNKTEFEREELRMAPAGVPFVKETYSLLDRYAAYKTRKNNAQILNKQTELTALQSQINPHFLYNTLETIRGQALIDDNEEIAKMVEALSAFFRYSISRKGNKPYLTEIDSAIGDGDHGIGMAGGMQKAKKKLLKMAGEENAYQLFETAGQAMLMSMGGASGVIFGSLYLAGAKGMDPKSVITSKDLADMEKKSLEAIQERGGAQVGDKTMVDALSPAVDALAANADKGLLEMLKAAEASAKQGVEDTKKYVAKFGRAKSLLERAIGHQDAGATSVYLIFQGMREFVEGKLA